jgi:predicted P-loop ATPase
VRLRNGPIDQTAILRDRDQLWAEAAAREAAGDSIRRDASLWQQAAVEQQARTKDDLWYEVMADKLDCHQEGRIETKTLWQLVELDVGKLTHQHSTRLAGIMHKLGWQRARPDRSQGQARPGMD